MYSNRRPYYGLNLSIADFFREPVRYLKQSNTQESMMEKPYSINEYPKMHLSLPDFDYKPREIPGFLGPIAGGAPTGGFAIMDYGDAECRWGVVRVPGGCIRESVVITLTASHFWSEEFKFNVEVASDSIGIKHIMQLPGTEAFAWDEQRYVVEFPVNPNGSVTICGFASTHTLTSQTFETVVAGMPVSLRIIGGAISIIERGQGGAPATLLKSAYGTKAANCGCITISSSCGEPPEWDDESSATTVTPNSECVIAVADGCAPYDWSVSGTGFSLANAQTQTGSNTLIADETACGTATITVTDQCGEVTGYVRCTTGVWSSATNGCIISGAWTAQTGDYSFEKIQGKYKQSQTVVVWKGLGGAGEESCGNVDCVALAGAGNCVDCLNWACSDINKPYGCGGWCCGSAGCGPYPPAWDGGWCIKNASLSYKEWVCA